MNTWNRLETNRAFAGKHPMTPMPLRALTRGYTREPDVLDEITRLENLRCVRSRADFLRSLTADSPSEDSLRHETLLYFARDYRRQGDVDSAWLVAEVLIERTKKSIIRHLSSVPGISRDQKEELMDSLASTLYTEWLSDDPRHEFWEVRFNLCLKRKIIDELKPLRRIFENEYSSTLQQDDNGSVYDPTEHLPDDSALSPELLAVARMMLVQIPEPWRTAFYLKHCEEWVEESNDPQQPSIARHLGVTGRSIRNYLRHAEKFLLDNLSPERH